MRESSVAGQRHQAALALSLRSVSGCTSAAPGVQRLMKTSGLQGIQGRRLHGCTRREEAAFMSEDLVTRRFRLAEPDRPYVSDHTGLPTFAGTLLY
jgi:hypothetical protein